MTWLRSLHKDHFAGAVAVLFGLAAVYFARSLDRGTMTQMGPGFFPTALGVLMVFVGVLIIIGGNKQTAASVIHEFPGEPADVLAAAHATAEHRRVKPEWRGWGCILGGFVAFILLFKSAGAVPATTALAIISALAERGNSWMSAILLALFANAVLVIVFWWALRMPMHLFWWAAS